MGTFPEGAGLTLSLAGLWISCMILLLIQCSGVESGELFRRPLRDHDTLSVAPDVNVP